LNVDGNAFIVPESLLYRANGLSVRGAVVTVLIASGFYLLWLFGSQSLLADLDIYFFADTTALYLQAGNVRRAQATVVLNA